MKPQITQITQIGPGSGDPETYAIIGACMEVHRQLGSGFLEAVYQHATAIEMLEREIPFIRETQLPIRYKGHELPCTYRADFVCFGSILIELKSIEKLGPIERAQVINYLKATGFKRALLINFGASSLQYERIVL